MKLQHLSIAIVAIAAVTFTTMARAAEDVLTVVPDNALAVVVVNQVGQTQDKIIELGEKLNVPAGTALRALPLDLKTQTNVDRQGSVALAVVPEKESGHPKLLWFVPTTNYKAFVDQFESAGAGKRIAQITIADTEFVAARKGGYAMLAAKDDRATLRAARGAKGNAATQIAAVGDWAADQDIYAIAMPAGVKFAQQQLLIGLAAGKAQLDQAGEQAEMALAGLEMYEALFKALDKHVSHFAAGVLLKEDGSIHLTSRTLAVKGSGLEKAVKETQPFAGSPLAGLPGGAFAFAGGGTMSPEWTEALMDFSFRVIKMYPGGDQLTDEEIRKLADMSLESMKGVRSMAMMLRTGEEDEPLYSNMLLALSVDDAKEYLDKYVRTMEEMVKIGKRTNNPLFSSYEVERVQIGGKPGLRLGMSMDVFMGDEQPPEAKKMFEVMFGVSGNLDIYMVAANPKTVVGAYISRKAAEEAMQAVNQPDGQLQQESAIKKMAEQLPKGAHGVAYWSPKGTVQFFSRMIAQMAPGAPIEFPDFPETSPIGLAVKFSSTGIETSLVIPADVLQAASETIQKLGGDETSVDAGLAP